MNSLGRTFEVVKRLSKKRSKSQLFHYLDVGDKIEVKMEMVNPGKTCQGLSRVPLLMITDLKRSMTIEKTLIQTINAMSLFEWKEVI
jgi:hypothetical protein